MPKPDDEHGDAPAHEKISSQRVDTMSSAALVSELNQFHNISDAIYKVRSKAVEEGTWGPHDGDSWDHPAVKRYGELLKRLDAWLKAAGMPPLSGK